MSTWQDGVAVPSDDRSWSVTSGEFLGCGFRVQVPLARERGEATAFVHGQVRRLADLLGATVDEVPWSALASGTGVGGGPLVLEGGWEPVFRGPPGAASTRVFPGPERAPDRAAPLVLLPWPVTEGSELDALPLHSTHETVVARRHLDAYGRDPTPEGLWLRSDGGAARSTAGNLLVAIDGAWWHPEPGPGRVPTWISEALATAVGAQPRRTSPAELVTEAGAGGVVVAVDGWGVLTRLNPASGRHRGSDDLWTRLAGARDTLLDHS